MAITAEEAALWTLFPDRSTDQAVNAILGHYQDYIERRVQKLSRIHWRRIDEDEIRTEVYKAVVSCIPKYDPSKGVRFIPFCGPRMRGAVVDYLRSVSDSRRKYQINAFSLSETPVKEEMYKDSLAAAPEMGDGDPEFWVAIAASLQKRGRQYWFAVNAVYRLGWTQEQVARFKGVTPAAVNLWLTEAYRYLRRKGGRALKKWLTGGKRQNTKPERKLLRRRVGAAFFVRNKGHACVHKGCSRPARRRGLCQKHYVERLTGYATCTHPGCPQPAYAKGLCETHRRKQINQGTRCQESGCTHPQYSGGRCQHHYRVYKRQTNAPCSVPDCGKPKYAKGLCTLHYLAAKRKAKQQQAAG